MLQKRSLLRNLIAAFGAVMFIATAAGIYIYSRPSIVKENIDWTSHTYRVIQSTAKMLSSMVDQETGLRGYLIDGQDEFLEPYPNGTVSFQEALKRTLELTADNPAQQARLADLERIATEWKRGHADRAIALASVSATLEQGQKLESSGAGKSLFDAFRAKLKDIEDDERALLTVRSEAEADALTNSNVATVLGIVGALLAAAASAFALARSIASPSAALVEFGWQELDRPTRRRKLKRSFQFSQLPDANCCCIKKLCLA